MIHRGPFPVPFEERFWEKVQRTDGCWLWTGPRNNNGYGLLLTSGKNGRGVSAHRWTYEQFRGPIPPGYQIDHLCRNTSCVNPAHLEAVTAQENNRRSKSPSAINSGKTHCVHGHEFTEENIYRDNKGARLCRECQRRREREYKARLTAKGLTTHGTLPRLRITLFGVGIVWTRKTDSELESTSLD